MATQTDSPQLQSGTTKDPRSRQRHGLATPESTPVPDDARIAADQERRLHETIKQSDLPPIREDANGEHQSDDHRPGAGGQTLGEDNGASESDDSDDEGPPPPSSSQIKAVEHLISCVPKDHRKILNVDPPAEDSRQDKENMVNSFRELGCLTHPDFNKHKSAERAFKVLLKAAKKLGVDQDDINEVKYWDGKESLGELHLAPDGRWSAKLDSMEGLESSLVTQPANIRPPEWEKAREYLHQLMHNPDDAGAIAELMVFNRQTVDANRARSVPETLLQSFTIDIDTFRAIFRAAAPVLERLRKSHADTEAYSMFDAFNQQLREFNRLHQYPEDWTMDLPPEHVPQTRVPPVERPQESSGTGHRVESGVATQHRYRRCARKDGYVREDGLDKKIEGCLKVGAGHQMLISRPGNDGLLIYEKVAASTFGKGFAAAYSKRPDAKTITNGEVKELEGKEFEDMVIAGVASDRRDPKKEPVDGWARQPRTIVLVGFGNNPTQFAWYTRSVLGTKFGQALVDEEIDGYRVDSGEHDPLQPTVEEDDPGSPRQTRTRPVPAEATAVESATAQRSLMARLQALEILMTRSMEK